MVQLCKDLQAPIHVVWGRTKTVSYIPENARYDCVAMYIWESHAFFVSSACSKVKEHPGKKPTELPNGPPKAIIATQKRYKEHNVARWEDWNGDFRPGRFWTNLHEARSKLHREGICPRVHMSSNGALKSLFYNEMVLHSKPREAALLAEFAATFERVTGRPLSYDASSLPAFTARAFTELCRPTERPIRSKETVAQLLAEQSGTCSMCGADVESEFHVDHTIPRAAFGSDDTPNLSILCIACHALKTSEETCSLGVEDSFPLLSRFNLETYKNFVETAKPPQLVAELHEPRHGSALEIDVARCRASAYLHANQHPLCIFSPLDEIIPAREGELADFMWIDVGQPKSLYGAVPYWSPGWYTKATVQYLLEMA